MVVAEISGGSPQKRRQLLWFFELAFSQGREGSEQSLLCKVFCYLAIERTSQNQSEDTPTVELHKLPFRDSISPADTLRQGFCSRSLRILDQNGSLLSGSFDSSNGSERRRQEPAYRQLIRTPRRQTRGETTSATQAAFPDPRFV